MRNFYPQPIPVHLIPITTSDGIFSVLAAFKLNKTECWGAAERLDVNHENLPILIE